MYLKSIEMVGFKSFAERTQLVFEPGMMAIVGPNGCGKSNVSDAIRWVLGEQSPKALRGAAMTDVIFNGTDTARPLAMAEVSLTFTDCEETLGTDYHDVTVTRRVFRSGEGQYFLNRSPCRLRDIQRLFLDTGIGTSSYCVMEQGHIDLILSSRPDDRRAVFEEASGVARFKADRREALRKLDHTQANLDRADDVIRELSRQLVSLQRQAGKARRYKALRERLAALEAYLGRLRLASLDSSLASLDSSLAAKRAEEERLKADVEASATAAETLRAAIGTLETAIAAALDEAAAAKSRKAMAEERVRANRERVAELDTLFARDDAETQSAHAALALHAETLAALETEKAKTAAAAEAAAATDREKQSALAAADAKTRALRERLQQLRQEVVQLENVLARRQAELDQLEAASRSNRLRKERLLSEKDDAERAAAGFAERLASLAEEAAALEAKSVAASEALAAAEKKRQARAAALAETQRAAAVLQRSLSATQAKIDLVKGAKAAVGFPPGARKLLKDPRLAGTLADRVRAEKPFARALETALRPWLDALLCETPELALSLCGDLAKGKVGSARFLFPADGAPPVTPPGAGEPLLAHVKPAKAWAGVLSRLLSRVRVVPDAAAIPLPPAADGPDYVTRDGIFLSATGAAELFLPQADESNPLSLAEQRREWEAEAETLAAEEAEKRQAIAALEKELAASGKEASDARAAM
ncbi:MAG: AAA family ATPase, partial [Kiritimatiellae bacterium]|nr:AAA family ATPase [Kiritimatiellia bacterium]